MHKHLRLNNKVIPAALCVCMQTVVKYALDTVADPGMCSVARAFRRDSNFRVSSLLIVVVLRTHLRDLLSLLIHVLLLLLLVLLLLLALLLLLLPALLLLSRLLSWSEFTNSSICNGKSHRKMHWDFKFQILQMAVPCVVC